MKIKALAIGLMFAATTAWAADADGNWVGSLDTPGGAVEVAFQFKVDGTKLTGTTVGPDGTALELKQGKVEGNKLSFSMDVDFGGQVMTLNYTGVVESKEIKMNLDFMDQPMAFVLKKKVD
jgi:hypothetical protein